MICIQCQRDFTRSEETGQLTCRQCCDKNLEAVIGTMNPLLKQMDKYQQEKTA